MKTIVQKETKKDSLPRKAVSEVEAVCAEKGCQWKEKRLESVSCEALKRRLENENENDDVCRDDGE